MARKRLSRLAAQFILGTTFILTLTIPARATTDYNGDGLDDVWQQLYNAWDLLPGEDEDHDGCTNLTESIAGTDPRNPADCIRVGGVSVAGSNVVLTVVSEVGKRYQLRSSTTPNGPTWTNEGAAVTGTGANLQFVTPMGVGIDRKFYQVQTQDQDLDSDGISDWAEEQTGSSSTTASSPSNASGGTATDGATLASLFSLTAAPVVGQDVALEKEGTQARIRLSRPVAMSAMRLTLAFTTAPNPDVTKGTAVGSDYTLSVTTPGGMVTGTASGTVTIPAGVSEMDVMVTPALDTAPEVPELLTMNVLRPGTGPATPPLQGTATIEDANGTVEANRTLFVAFLGKEAGVSTTATGIATALVEGNNDGALVSLTFSNLTSLQNTAYIRVDAGLDILSVGLGQVTGKSWPIRAAQTKITDQEMLTALHAGHLYVTVTTEDNPGGEIRGNFKKAVGSTNFTYDPALHDQPTGWETLTNAELERDIYRFLEQCTYGPTAELYTEVRAAVDAALSVPGQTYLKGLENWLDKQMDIAQTPNPSLMTLVQSADNEEFVLRGNKPLYTGNDPQFGDVSYTVTYDTFGNPITGTTTNGTYNNNHPFESNRRREQWTLALEAKAQVRQRMTQALSEIVVISEIDTTVQGKHYGAASYWDMLATNAFGPYRTILEKVTYHPIMGIYLSHLRNRATYTTGGVTISPDENYAREIMQLFSIGLILRHPDGSLVLGTDGLPIPTYDQNDITELARVMTGLCHGARHANASVRRFNGLFFNNAASVRTSPTIEFNTVTSGFNTFTEGGGDSWWQAPWIYPMKMIGRIGTTVYHDFGAKTLFAGKHGETIIPAQTLPATGTANDLITHTRAETDLRLAHNALAGDPTVGSYVGHQNTPVNICRWLIQRLTTSNPSAGYLYRVTTRYQQTNGNLGLVLKAILLDYEARTLEPLGVGQGRMKEPLVHFMAVLRSLNAYTGVPLTSLRDLAVPFAVNESPSTTPYPQSEVDKFEPNASRFRFANTTANLGQSPLRAPSVFNWFLPDYTVPGAIAEAGLFAPEMQIATETNVVARVNRLWDFTWMNIVGQTTFPGVDGDDFIQLTGNAGPQVKVSVTQPPTTANEASFLSLQTVTFTTANWNTPQTVTVGAVDDNVPEGTHTTHLYHSSTSSDIAYSNIAMPTLDVTINDNEAAGGAGLIISETSGDTMVVEGGATDTYTLRLSSAPTQPVTVNLQTTITNFGAFTTDVTVSPASVTFDATNWSSTQTITVSAVNDTSNEGPEVSAIGHVISTTDPVYSVINALSAYVIVADNDANGTNLVSLLQTLNGTAAIEGGATDTYYLTLRRAPTANATVTPSTGSDLTASPASLTFSTTNWYIPQKVTITAQDDALSELTETVIVGNLVSGGGYNINTDVTVTVQDNDGGSLIITETSGGTSVTEGSTTADNATPPASSLDSYTMRLGSAPTSNVTVTITPERHPSRMAAWAKISGYYAGDTSGSNLQKDRIIFDYASLISLYNSAYTAGGGNANAAAAHYAATVAVVDKLDLLMCGGQLKAVDPNLTLADLSNTAIVHARKSLVNGVYRGYSTTRLSTDTANFNNEVRDRCRIAAYLMSISPASSVAR